MTKKMLPLLLCLGCSPAAEAPIPEVLEMNSAIVTNENNRVVDLVCPGATGCGDATGTLRVGVATRTITPDLNEGTAWMAGYSMGRAATGVHDDVWARVLSLRQGETRVGLVVLDVVGFFHDDVIAVREAAAELGFDHIVVTSTHNHEAKDTMGLWGENAVRSGYEPEYLTFVIERARQALLEARDLEREATMVVGLGEAPELVADSREPTVLDPTVYTLQFRANDNNAIATMVVWGNHPEVLDDDNTLITSDYPHYLRTRLETEYPGSTAVFFAGNLGGLTNPLHIVGCPDANGDATCHNGDFAKAEYIGHGVADVAVASLLDPILAYAAPALSVRRHSYLMTGTNVALALAMQLGLISRTGYRNETEFVPRDRADTINLRELEQGVLKLQTEVNGIRLGGVELLTVPGELYSELWMESASGGSLVETPAGADFPDAAVDPAIKTLVPAADVKIVLNQGNDALGYIIPKTQFDEQDPRAYKTNGQYGEQNSVGANTAPQLLDAVRRLYALEVR